MTTELQVKTKTIRDLLNQPKTKAEMRAALPEFMSIKRMTRVFMTTIQNTPKLLGCSQKSLIAALIQSCQLGLEPDGILGQAYIIPYGNEAKFQIGYKGLLALARRSDEITSFNAQVVYENDKFEFEYGLDEKLRHVPCMNGSRGELKAAYAVAKFRDGGYAFDVMFKSDVEKIRRSSKAKDTKDSPWNTWEEEMWRKTVAKRLCKYLPQSIETAKAAALDERIDMGQDEEILDIEPESVKTGLKVAKPKEAPQPAPEAPEPTATDKEPTATDKEPAGMTITYISKILASGKTKDKPPFRILGEGDTIYTALSEDHAAIAYRAMENGLQAKITHRTDKDNTIVDIDTIEGE